VVITREDVKNLSRIEIDIIYAYAECNMKACPTARAVYCDHRTVCYHLDRIKHITTLDPRNFYDLYKLIEILNEELPNGTAS